jgi:hypothetical protein
MKPRRVTRYLVYRVLEKVRARIVRMIDTLELPPPRRNLPT